MSSLTLDPDLSNPVVGPDAEIAAEGEWWTSCSTAQLKAIVAVGIAAGDRFDDAVREIERRSSASRSEIESLEAARKRRDARQGRAIRLAVVTGVVILTIVLAMVVASRL